MRTWFKDPNHANVLAIGAHPDDVEVGAGGFVSRLCREGAQVHLAVVSVPSQLEKRMAETRAGAQVLGVRSVVHIEQHRCRVEDLRMHELVRRLDMLIADVRPDLVITHSAHDLHWDHGLVNRAVVSALRRTPCDLLAFMSSFEMNARSRSLGQCFVDISETLDVKMEAIRAHATQVPRMDLDSPRDLARGIGRVCGVQYAEAYEVLRLSV
jgi:LmbE family N-acetylglucosaminyl deacetylase